MMLTLDIQVVHLDVQNLWFPYFKIMNTNKEFTMDGKNEDLFFLSNGHISTCFYSVLARVGYFPVSELKTF